ncbi:MAG: hypothetical protein OSB00_17170 [Sphingomonas bacterium]|nr:hypothetical protein [Sphingomonas bacterium]
MARMTGPELDRAIRDYCRATATTVDALATTAGVSRSVVDKLAHRAFPRDTVVDRLRGTMAMNPDGLAPGTRRGPGDRHEGAGALAAAQARSMLAEAVRHEAQARCDRRRQAMAEGAEPLDALPVRNPPVAGPGVAAMIRTVQNRAPDLWATVRTRAAAAGTLPGALLIQALERGLGVVDG